jgi:hypothetical protein
MSAEAEPLPSWNDTQTKAAIVGFVESLTRDAPDEDQIAVLDNDGTL